MIQKGGNRGKVYPPANQGPVISIIIATYNAGKCLANCLDSIVQQPYKNIEVLVFDGNSTDNTVEILKHYDNYISYWQSEPDDGIYSALNAAAAKATGDYMYFLGADDTLLPGFSVMAAHLKNPGTLYYGYCYRNGIQTGGAVTAYKLARFNICHHAIFYPSLVFKKYRYNTDYVVYADHALHIALWGDRSVKKQYLPVAVANYGAEGFSTRTRDPKFRHDKATLIKKYLGWITYLRYLNKIRKEAKKPGSDFF